MQLNVKVQFLVMLLLSTFAPSSALVETRPFFERSQEIELYKHFNVQADFQGDWIEQLNTYLAQFNYPSDFQSKGTNHLFKTYPTLTLHIPYISFADLPTPLVKLEDISAAYNTPIFIKNDAYTGGIDEKGCPIYGGNKVRKLEFLLAHAKSLGATKVLTFGCVGSNHAVATTVHAHRQGFEEVICMLKHQPPSLVVQQNLLMHEAYESELHYNGNNDIRKLETISVWLNHLKKDGKVPYMIPTGGSNAIGALGFVNAVFELVEQINQGLMPKPTHIYIPTGNCGISGTTAGLLLGCKAAGLDVQIVAVGVEPDDIATYKKNVTALFKQTNDLLHNIDVSFPHCSWSETDLTLEMNFAGPNYGVFTKEGNDAQALLRELEDIKLEGTYTAKAFAGMLHHVQQNPNQVALFWNTYCGLDMSHKTKQHNYKKLPRCLHDYFDDVNLQELDK